MRSDVLVYVVGVSENPVGGGVGGDGGGGGGGGGVR